MRIARDFCSIGVGAAIFFVGAARGVAGDSEIRQAGGKPQACESPLWRLAWDAASQSDSPIDAQRARVELVTLAIASGQGARARPLLEAEREPWVRAAGMGLSAAEAALNGESAVAETRMREARSLKARLNEWHVILAERSLLIGQAAMVMLSDAENSPDLALLGIWVAGEPPSREQAAARDGASPGRAHPLGDPLSRAQAAAWVCAAWVARRASDTPRADLEPAIRATLAYSERALPWDRLARLRQIAAGMMRCGMAGEGAATIEKIMGDGGAEALPADSFGMLTDAAIAYAALGIRERAEELLKLAEARAARGETGDAKTPWIGVAEARRTLGRPADQVNQAWREARLHAQTQPGFHRDIALARALGAAAAVGLHEIPGVGSGE